jgi:uncharacterized protein (TIGR03790 family)
MKFRNQNLFYSALLVIMAFCGAQISKAQSSIRLADRVLVVCNEKSPISKSIADDYMKRRGIKNVAYIACPDAAVNTNAETISFTDYLANIEKPLRETLSKHPEVDFIVLTKGVPIRLSGIQYGSYGMRSLDSFLAALDYGKIPGVINVDISDKNYGAKYHGKAWSNRFWNSKTHFSHVKFGGYLVTRLDGYTEVEAIALTTRSLEAESKMLAGTKTPGEIVLDACPTYGFSDKTKQPYSVLQSEIQSGDSIILKKESNYADYNSDMELAADNLRKRNFPVVFDKDTTFVGNKSDLKGYVSWGSNDRYCKSSLYLSLKFAPGAICETAVSTSARTFLPTHGGQTLVVDLISNGVTGMKGYTDEPLLQATASPSIMFDRFTRGWTLAESFYAASNLVGWQDIVIGDPICRAYREQ